MIQFYDYAIIYKDGQIINKSKIDKRIVYSSQTIGQISTKRSSNSLANLTSQEYKNNFQNLSSPMLNMQRIFQIPAISFEKRFLFSDIGLGRMSETKMGLNGDHPVFFK